MNNYIKYPKISEIGVRDAVRIFKNQSVDVFEKVDGANVQIRVDDVGNFKIGSRGSEINRRKIRSVTNNTHKAWFEQFQSWCYSQMHTINLIPNTIIFGEWMAPHTLHYNSSWQDSCIFLDLYDTNEESFVDYDLGKELMGASSSLRFVKPLHQGVLDEHTLEKLLFKNSSLRKGSMEGLVIKNYETENWGKVYHPDFSETKVDGCKINPYTLRRVEKAFLRLFDDGEEITVNTLKQEFAKDLQAEHPLDFYNTRVDSFWDKNLREISKKYF